MSSYRSSYRRSSNSIVHTWSSTVILRRTLCFFVSYAKRWMALPTAVRG